MEREGSLIEKGLLQNGLALITEHMAFPITRCNNLEFAVTLHMFSDTNLSLGSHPANK